MSHTLKDALRDRRLSVARTALRHIRGREHEASDVRFAGPEDFAKAISAWAHLERARRRVLRMLVGHGD
jgi:hypothetical protein